VGSFNRRNEFVNCTGIHKLIKMKNFYFLFIFLSLSILSCSESTVKPKPSEMEKSLNQNNNQVSVIINVSFTNSIDEIKKFITEEQSPLFFNLEDSGIVSFEWFLNENENTGTLVEVFKNANAFQELGGKVLGSPINLKFQKLFKIESLNVLGEISEEFKTKLQPMKPIFKSYAGGIN
tara:strand:+ start:392 stop:925 length:534 start_codon:yes stop_codon:yes gene_type:complete